MLKVLFSGFGHKWDKSKVNRGMRQLPGIDMSISSIFAYTRLGETTGPDVCKWRQSRQFSPLSAKKSIIWPIKCANKFGI